MFGTDVKSPFELGYISAFYAFYWNQAWDGMSVHEAHTHSAWVVVLLFFSFDRCWPPLPRPPAIHDTPRCVLGRWVALWVAPVGGERCCCAVADSGVCMQPYGQSMATPGQVGPSTPCWAGTTVRLY
jgi:hypothetical protein